MAPKKVHRVTVQFNWSKLMPGLRATFVKSITANCELYDSLADLATETDTFHPLNAEDDLHHELPQVPLSGITEAKDEVLERLKDLIKEMQENACDYYDEPMNFAPEDKEVTNVKIAFKAVSLKHLLEHFTFTKEVI